MSGNGHLALVGAKLLIAALAAPTRRAAKAELVARS